MERKQRKGLQENNIDKVGETSLGMRTLLEIPQAETPNKTLSLLHNPLV